MSATLPFLREIDAAVAHSSAQRRGDIVRHVTHLLLVSADQYSDDEIALIDDVLVRLVTTIEDSARALLAIRLGPYAKASPKILSVLARDDAIDIASPVLIQGERLDQATLSTPKDTPASDPSRNLSGKSDVEKLEIFANAGRFEGVIATLAGLTKLSPVFIERRLKEDDIEFLLVLAKAHRLSWQATKFMLALVARESPHSPDDIKQYEASFARLTPATARKIMDFYRTREQTSTKSH